MVTRPALGARVDDEEQRIVPMYHRDQARWLDVMRGTIALNASYFNSHRMVSQYAAQAWL